MGATKNIFGGIIWAAISLVTFVIIPLIGLNAVKTVDLGSMGSINYGRFDIDGIIFYVQSIGLIQAGLAFGKGSSPKGSKRKALFSLAHIVGGGAYAYIIKFSGLSTVPIILAGLGEVIISFDAFVMMLFGVVVMNASLSLFDLIVAIKDQHTGAVINADIEFKAALARVEAGEFAMSAASGDPGASGEPDSRADTGERGEPGEPDGFMEEGD